MSIRKPLYQHDLHSIAKKLPFNTTIGDVHEAMKFLIPSFIYTEDEVIVEINKATFDRIMNARKAD